MENYTHISTFQNARVELLLENMNRFLLKYQGKNIFKVGDCGCASSLLVGMPKSIGIAAYQVIGIFFLSNGKTRGHDLWSHASVEIYK